MIGANFPRAFSKGRSNLNNNSAEGTFAAKVATGIMKDLFAKLFDPFNAHWSDGFAYGFASLFVDVFGVDEFSEWHRTPLFGWIPAESVRKHRI
jgi:hypothetical protein